MANDRLGVKWLAYWHCAIVAVALLLSFFFCPTELEGLEGLSSKVSQNPFY